MGSPTTTVGPAVSVEGRTAVRPSVILVLSVWPSGRLARQAVGVAAGVAEAPGGSFRSSYGRAAAWRSAKVVVM